MLTKVQEAMQQLCDELGNGFYTDDWKWNDKETVIEFNLRCFIDEKQDFDCGTYKFVYREDLGDNFQEELTDFYNDILYRMEGGM